MRRWFTKSLSCLPFEIKKKRERDFKLKKNIKSKIIDNYELQRNKTDFNMLIY